MDGVSPATVSPSLFAPSGSPVQLPNINAQTRTTLDRAIQSGDPRVFMQIATRAGMNPQQAMEYLRQNVQRSGQPPSEGAQRIGAALQQRLQADQSRQPRPQPGEDPNARGPGGQEQSGGIFGAIFKAIGDFFKGIWNFFSGGNRQQPPAPDQGAQPRPQR